MDLVFYWLNFLKFLGVIALRSLLKKSRVIAHLIGAVFTWPVWAFQGELAEPCSARKSHLSSADQSSNEEREQSINNFAEIGPHSQTYLLYCGSSLIRTLMIKCPFNLPIYNMAVASPPIYNTT